MRLKMWQQLERIYIKMMIFDISDGVSTVSLPQGKQWQIGQAQVAEYKEKGDLFIRDNKVIIKMRPEYERSETTEPFWGIFGKELGTTESVKKELKNLIGEHGFETVKPVEMLQRLIYHGTEKDDIILDFFSGSATTAHAVMKLNAEDGGHRKFILVQIPEKTKEDSQAYSAGYKTIGTGGCHSDGNNSRPCRFYAKCKRCRYCI